MTLKMNEFFHDTYYFFYMMKKTYAFTRENWTARQIFLSFSIILMYQIDIVCNYFYLQ